MDTPHLAAKTKAAAPTSGMASASTLASTLEGTLEDLAPRVLRYCRGRSSDPGLAEEAAQEALTALVSRWRRIGPPASVEAFTFTIARRRLSWALWKRRLSDPLDHVVHRDNGLPGPERRAVARDHLVKLRAAVDGLKPKLRDALLLIAAAELDTATAANVLGISPSALKMRVSRARAQVVTLMKDVHDVRI